MIEIMETVMVNRVYFLGAGSSKAINNMYPTLIELTDAVTNNFLLRNGDNAIVSHFYSIPNDLRGNLELMLSYLYSYWPWKTTAEQELDISLYRYLAFEICTHLNSIKTEDVSEEFKVFANYLRSHKHGIISLNYDTLLEETYRRYFLLKETTIHHNYSVVIEDSFDDNVRTSINTPYIIDDVIPEQFNFISKRITINREAILTLENNEILNLVDDPRLSNMSNFTDKGLIIKNKLDAYLNIIKHPIRPNPIYHAKSTDPKDLENRILKLHGSIDWVDENSETIRIGGKNGSLAKKEKLPLIIPPILDKTGHYKNNKIRDLWFDAHSLMEQADEIIISGFSFPVTDLSVRYLFQSALNRNPNVRVIVVNRDSEENLKFHYHQVFSGTHKNNLDFRYCGRNDSLSAYISSEIIRH